MKNLSNRPARSVAAFAAVVAAAIGIASFSTTSADDAAIYDTLENRALFSPEAIVEQELLDLGLISLANESGDVSGDDPQPLPGCIASDPAPGDGTEDNSNPQDSYSRFDSAPIPSACGGEFKMSVHFRVYQGQGTPLCDAGQCSWIIRWQAYIWWRPNPQAAWQFTPNPSDQYDEWHVTDEEGNTWPQTGTGTDPGGSSSPPTDPQPGNSQPGSGGLVQIVAQCPGLGQSNTTSYTITISGPPGGPSLSATLDFTCACDC